MEIRMTQHAADFTVCRKNPRLSIVVVIIVALLGSACFAAEPTVVGYLPPHTYRQQLTIRFYDEASAARAALEIQPLWDGHYRAISCRWDDNWTSDNPETREVMEENGIRGTWYLNGRTFFARE